MACRGPKLRRCRPHRLGGYSTLALRASWHFTPDWQVEAKLANAFDRDYETAYYYTASRPQLIPDLALQPVLWRVRPVRSLSMACLGAAPM